MKIRASILIQKLLELKLPLEDFAIFGSGPMSAHGIKEFNGDIDVIARNKAWEKSQIFFPAIDSGFKLGMKVVKIDSDIEIFNNWAPGDWDINLLIDNAEIIEGIKFVELKEVLKWKKILGRDKDQKHIMLIEDYLKVL